MFYRLPRTKKIVPQFSWGTAWVRELPELKIQFAREVSFELPIWFQSPGQAPAPQARK